MIWTLCPSALVSIVFIIISTVTGNWKLTGHVIGIIGLLSIGLAGVFAGAFVSGDRMRANRYTESTDDRQRRGRWSTNCVLFALPCLVTSGVIYLWVIK